MEQQYPKGLRNQLNNCYLNSLLQSLASCPPFLNYLKHLQTDSREDRHLFHTELCTCLQAIRTSSKSSAIHDAAYMLKHSNTSFQNDDQQVSLYSIHTNELP